jgi:DNA helicase-2/ATP-dependent DNA helicase PcrA
MSNFIPSPYQTAIFNFVENGAGNAIVKAVAGSGKTTTIVKALDRVRGSSLFLAFNRAIAVELKGRGVNAKTFHAMVMPAVLRSIGLNNVDNDKLFKLVDAEFSDEDAYLYGTFARKLVGIARQVGVGCLVEDTEEVWNEMAAHHDLEPDSDRAIFTVAIEKARQLLRISNACKSMADFDDMLYFSVKNGISLPKYDFVFVDEAQDTNSIQRAILRKIMKPTSRFIAVGDPAQAIYGFRGADSNSLDLIAEEFNCIELPLTVSYRCPRSVVAHAQQWVSHIEPAPNAPEGEVVSLGANWDPTKIFRAGDLVVCRTTKSLIAQAYRLIRARIPATVMGREIGQGLVALIKRMNAPDLDQLIERVNLFTIREVEKAIAANNESKAQSVQDKSDTLLVIIGSLEEDRRTIADLRGAIEVLFADKANAVLFGTIHKSKGREAHRVFWLNSALCPSKWARQDWQKQQERNLCYVATTRAIESLFLIEEPRDTNEEGA